MVYLLRLAGRSHGRAVSEVAATLERVGLEDYLTRRTSELSHGMYKRLSLAQAFLGDPTVVLLDEPTAGLDPGNAQRIRELIRSFTTDGTRTVVVSSHDMAEMQELCSHVAILKQGKMVSVGQVDALCRAHRRVQIRLVHPLSSVDQAALRIVPQVLELEFKSDDTMVLQIADVGDATDLLLQRWLLDHGALIRDYQDGRTLAEHFLAVTGAPAGTRPG